MVLVDSVLAEDDYLLRIRFNNGEGRLFDMKPYLKYPVYQRLQNPGFFSLAHAEYGTVVWPEEIDIAPETLYERSVPIAMDDEAGVS